MVNLVQLGCCSRLNKKPNIWLSIKGLLLGKVGPSLDLLVRVVFLRVNGTVTAFLTVEEVSECVDRSIPTTRLFLANIGKVYLRFTLNWLYIVLLNDGIRYVLLCLNLLLDCYGLAYLSEVHLHAQVNLLRIRWCLLSLISSICFVVRLIQGLVLGLFL